jgi:hypothetical protein
VIWVLVMLWAAGACTIVFAFALGVGGRRFGAAIALFFVGLLIIGSSVVAGMRLNERVHGIAPYEAPELSRPGGT